MVGSDSQARDDVCFVTAVVIHRLGRRRTVFLHQDPRQENAQLRQLDFYEAHLSLDVASRLAEDLPERAIGSERLDPLGCRQERRNQSMIRELVRRS